MRDAFKRFVDWRQTGKINGPIAAIFERANPFTVNRHSPGVNYDSHEIPYSIETLENLVDGDNDFTAHDRAEMRRAIASYPGQDGPGGTR